MWFCYAEHGWRVDEEQADTGEDPSVESSPRWYVYVEGCSIELNAIVLLSRGMKEMRNPSKVPRRQRYL